MPSQIQIRERITQDILTALKEGTTPWRQPWLNDPNAGLPTNIASKRRYGGVNSLTLEISRMQHGFQSKFWGTYRQFQQAGTNVRRGQKGTQIVFYKPVVVDEGVDENGARVEKTVPLLRTYHVFNCEQTHGLDEFRVGMGELSDSNVSFEMADSLISNSRADIRFGGNRAFYTPHGDFIQMPHRHQFSGATFYETVFHEMCHWSEHPDRLNWIRSKEHNNYALGELVAEMGSCFACTELGIPLGEGLANHVSYMSNWLQALRNDHSFIFKASTQASKACDYITSFSEQPVEEPAIVA